MEFKIELLMAEIDVVQNTEEGEFYIKATAEQLVNQLPTASRAAFLEEIARAYTGAEGQGALADRIMEIVDDNMTPAAAESLIKNMKGRYHL